MKIVNKHFLKAGGLLAALLVTLLTPGLGRADPLAVTVPAGYDLFQTVSSGTSYMGINFQGVPLGTFNFGGSIGTKTVDNTDTIVQRLNDATPGNNGITGLAIQALQLVSTTEVSLVPFGGSGVGYLYVTLDSNKTVTGGTDPTTGLARNTMQIFSATSGVGGTFNSYLDFNVDFSASLGGPILGTAQEMKLTTLGALWSPTPAPGSLVIDGVNKVVPLPVGDVNFYPCVDPATSLAVTCVHDASGAGHHTVKPAPEPSTFALFGAGLALFGYSRRKTIRS